MTETFMPPGTTHVHTHKFHGTITHYKVVEHLHFNSVTDHPTECWQSRKTYYTWFPPGNPKGSWVATESRYSNELEEV